MLYSLRLSLIECVNRWIIGQAIIITQHIFIQTSNARLS